MTKLELSSCNSVLRTLDTHLQQDGFALVSVCHDETTYTAANAGWTTRFRALVRTYEPECNCPYCTVCEDEPTESLMLEIEMEMEGLGYCLRGSLDCSVGDAANTYLSHFRPLAKSFPARIQELKWNQFEVGSDGYWQDTRFFESHVLRYLGDIRWQEGEAEDATRCYTALLPSRMCKSPLLRKLVNYRLDELSRGVRFEERSRLPY